MIGPCARVCSLFQQFFPEGGSSHDGKSLAEPKEEKGMWFEYGPS